MNGMEGDESDLLEELLPGKYNNQNGKDRNFQGYCLFALFGIERTHCTFSSKATKIIRYRPKCIC